MKKFINITLLIIWMIIIFIMSNDNGAASSYKSDEVTSFIIDKINLLTGNDIYSGINNIIFIVRKCAHFIEYFILGFLVINVIKDYNKISFSCCLFVILICILYSISDEIHQLFISGRSGRIIDVLIDTIGSVCGTIFYLVIYKVRLLKFKKINQK